MEALEFRLDRPYIALCDLLKLAGIADSGGHGKRLVAEGAVQVDGKPETRKTAKITAGQVVQCLDRKIVVLNPD